MKLEPQFKFLIPLETEGLKKEFFTEEAGFIGAYSDVTGEIENVSTVDCFYLLFDYFLDTKEKQIKIDDIRELEYHFSQTTLTANPRKVYIINEIKY